MAVRHSRCPTNHGVPTNIPTDNFSVKVNGHRIPFRPYMEVRRSSYAIVGSPTSTFWCATMKHFVGVGNRNCLWWTGHEMGQYIVWNDDDGPLRNSSTSVRNKLHYPDWIVHPLRHQQLPDLLPAIHCCSGSVAGGVPDYLRHFAPNANYPCSSVSPGRAAGTNAEFRAFSLAEDISLNFLISLCLWFSDFNVTFPHLLHYIPFLRSTNTNCDRWVGRQVNCHGTPRSGSSIFTRLQSTC